MIVYYIFFATEAPIAALRQFANGQSKLMAPTFHGLATDVQVMSLVAFLIIFGLLAAIAVAISAVKSAPDGFEDEFGFAGKSPLPAPVVRSALRKNHSEPLRHVPSVTLAES
ncbi:MAG TPA: hypothetical protein VG734_26645 [Lacunisphaera sp.]|nr:hypothetical protein [Lacunisphaera sp.]